MAALLGALPDWGGWEALLLPGAVALGVLLLGRTVLGLNRRYFYREAGRFLADREKAGKTFAAGRDRAVAAVEAHYRGRLIYRQARLFIGMFLFLVIGIVAIGVAGVLGIAVLEARGYIGAVCGQALFCDGAVGAVIDSFLKGLLFDVLEVFGWTVREFPHDGGVTPAACLDLLLRAVPTLSAFSLIQKFFALRAEADAFAAAHEANAVRAGA